MISVLNLKKNIEIIHVSTVVRKNYYSKRFNVKFSFQLSKINFVKYRAVVVVKNFKSYIC